jgi:hypothetical protein
MAPQTAYPAIAQMQGVLLDLNQLQLIFDLNQYLAINQAPRSLVD